MTDEQKESLKLISSVQRQLIHRTLAQSVTVPECPYFPLFEALQKLRSHVGDEVLINEFGKDKIEAIRNKIKVLGIKISEIKSYYDGINNLVIESEDISSQRFVQYRKNMAEILIDIDFFRIFTVLLEASTIKNLAIPNEVFKSLQRKQRKLEMEEDKTE